VIELSRFRQAKVLSYEYYSRNSIHTGPGRSGSGHQPPLLDTKRGHVMSSFALEVVAAPKVSRLPQKSDC